MTVGHLATGCEISAKDTVVGFRSVNPGVSPVLEVAIRRLECPLQGSCVMGLLPDT